jgi:16S rRNA (uracil1498-N3)-methyltransferase
MKHITTSFYIPPEGFIRGEMIFPEGEAEHLSRVLRAREGDEVIVVDGVGHTYRVRLTKADIKRTKGEVLAEIKSAPEPNIINTLGIGTIHQEKLEFAWDACVQLGISRLLPVRTEYGIERLRADGRNIERLRAVSIRAMKQSRRAVLPQVLPPVNLPALLKEGTFKHILFGDPDGLPSPPKDPPKLGEGVLLLVGPEGGFSSEEKRLIADCGGIPISLGPRRLRTETAAIALAIISLKWSEDI